MRSLGHRRLCFHVLGSPDARPSQCYGNTWPGGYRAECVPLTERAGPGGLRGDSAGVCADCPHGSHAEAQLPPVLPPGMVRAGTLHVRALGCSRHRLPRGPPTALCSPWGWVKPWYQGVPGAACEGGAGAGGRGGRGKLPVLQLPPHLLTLGGELAPSPGLDRGGGADAVSCGGALQLVPRQGPPGAVTSQVPLSSQRGPEPEGKAVGAGWAVGHEKVPVGGRSGELLSWTPGARWPGTREGLQRRGPAKGSAWGPG